MPFQKGHLPTTGCFEKGHNIGIKTRFIKGQHGSSKTEFKKGQIGRKCLNWKGGKKKHRSGYILTYKPKHPFAVGIYVFEHRLIIEKYIGHYLLPKEHSHHINGIKTDNRPKNLIAFSNNSAHIRFHKNPDSVKPSEIIFDGRKLQ